MNGRSVAGRRRKRGRDIREDLVDVRAGQRDSRHGDQRNQRHEQRVLEQILTLIPSCKPLQSSDKSHDDYSSLRVGSISVGAIASD
jgi:hypothetical protein